MDLAALRVDADPSLDRLARIVREALGVPVGLVSIVEPGRQVFPGAVGLPEPWQTDRQTPLTHSFCQYVVADEAPLVIEDARLDRRLRDNGAIPDLGVIAYAGFPLRGADGTVIGSVCAIDDEPRHWEASELLLLADVAAVASVELQLRDSRAALARTADLATELSARARLLLSLSEAFADTVTATDVAVALQDVAAKHLGCVHAGIWICEADDARTLVYVDHPLEPWPQAERLRTLVADAADSPIGETVATRVPLFFPDLAVRDARFPDTPLPALPDDGEARAVLPLVAGSRTLGGLALIWDHPRAFSDDDRVTITALTSYTAQAVHRAGLLAERTTAARTLQAALLTDRLPSSDHVQLAARYVPVAERDVAGGDWYDAHLLASGALHVTIGDVQGHDLRAAAAMGSLRNMLRTLDWALDESPASILRRLDQAATEFAIGRHATVLFGRLERDDATGDVAFEWSSAGHLPPLLALPDGSCVVLDDDQRNDPMLWVRPDRVRRDRRATIPAGSTLLLYTDGLIETRRQDVDTGIECARASLAKHGHLALEPLLDAILADTIGPRAEDDVALLAVRLV